MDDYIRASEPIADHLTKYSGIQAGDLDASSSTRQGLSLMLLVPFSMPSMRSSANALPAKCLLFEGLLCF